MKIFSFSRFLGALVLVVGMGGWALHTPVALAYSDLEGYPFSTATDYLTEQGFIGGYSDGTVRPNASINRAEFLKVLMGAGGLEVGGNNCFSDVTDQWFAPYVCGAAEAGLVNGYGDGSFKPENTISLVEALKITSKGLELELAEAQGGDWYSGYLETLAAKNYIPYTLRYYDERLTRGEAFELLWRILTENETQEATTIPEFTAPSTGPFDFDRVKDAWFQWTNEARAAHGLPAYTEDYELDRTAYVWSVYSRTRGYMDHKRPGTTAYYDYYAIQNWFKDLGVSFPSVGGYTFTENIGHGPYSCREADCTDELIRGIKYTFDYFISEAGSSYRPHYNSIMNDSFQKIGFGMVITDSSYYMTVHYATAVELVE